MTSLLAKATDPARWRRLIERTIENHRRRRLDDKLDALWKQRGPVAIRDGETTIIAEALWYNPNHFLRLRLFVDALAQCGGFRLLGLLRKRDDVRARRALERIGFREFIYVEDDDEFRTEQFLADADVLLHPVQTHADLLKLQLPGGIPAYTYYDTVLKVTANAQPLLDHPSWRTVLAETLRDLAIYRRELAGRKVGHVALSHLWKSEWATLTWLALGKDIPVYHLTGFMESMRVRRLRAQSEYRVPVETLSPQQFLLLPAPVRARIADYGRRMLNERVAGNADDINVRYAYRPELRVHGREQARGALGVADDRPLVVVYAHAWYDFPHIFGMASFVDFKDWFLFTLEQARAHPETQWVLKPHPTERWYGGYYLSDIIGDLPPNIRLVGHDVDSQTVVTAADAIVTVHGTIALEAMIQGKPVILADQSYISDWKIGHRASNREDYARLLAEAGRLLPPSNNERELAAACFALALAEPPPESTTVRLTCDSGGSVLYRELLDRMADTALDVDQGRESLVRFIGQNEIDSYAAFNLITAARRVEFGEARAVCAANIGSERATRAHAL